MEYNSIYLVPVGILLYFLIVSVRMKYHAWPAGPRISPPLTKKTIPISKLTFRAIIRWEQLRDKSFSLMDFTKKEDIEALLYTACRIDYPFEVFQSVLSNGTFAKGMVRSLERETQLIGQYQRKGKDAIENHEDNPERITTIISALIVDGLDPHYALNEMELCDLPIYLKAMERKKREEMETERFWTYFTILPHIDAKKLRNGAKDLVTFPWEAAAAKEESERALREDLDSFEQFMKEGKNFKS